MAKKKEYNFDEKAEEYSAKDGGMIPVWISPKYLQAKKKVIEMLESEQYQDVLDESDFWILMNRTKSGKMAYTGLIISHNGCLKINDTLSEELKFNPKCLSYLEKDVDLGGFVNCILFVYDSSKLEEDKQKIYEVGEVNSKNCTNEYPYAMALKRCMDRVILKNSKLAYSGVYSDSEAEEFKERIQEQEKETKIVSATPISFIPATKFQLKTIKDIYSQNVEELKLQLANLGKKKIDELSIQEASNLIKKVKGE